MDYKSQVPAVGGPNSQPTTAKCEVLSRLAIGGMAELYLARQHGAIIVLKRILPHLAEDPEFVRMFHDEANLAATLDHPNIVRVYDQGRDGDNFYFTMEYVHGENVRTMIRAAQKAERFLPLHHVVQIGVGVARGLNYAHDRRDDTTGLPLEIVHRDVSPTNVLVAFDGAVKIVDFGIAKAAAATHITQAGMLKGKASYMSPEQCRAEPVDRRSDVFAIGILLYEMTTLTRLFRGDNELAVLHQVLTGRVDPPSERVPGFPPGLEGILLKALQQSPDDRYQTAAELGEALAEWGHVMGLPSSEAGLGQYLRELCGDRPLPWKDDEDHQAPVPAAAAPSSESDDGETRVARSDGGNSQIAGGAPDLTPTPWPAGDASGNGVPPAQPPVDAHAVEPTTVSTPPTASESGLAPVNESTPVATARPVFSAPTAPAV
ncbi:MAG: protein kinase, partial [Nannocystaceae bacterium]|nr:protein kinase [Nannocystaceae bacterium]